MNLQEILKAQGLSDEQIEKTIGEMKQNKIFTASEENLDIRYGKLKNDFDNLTKQHGESATLIEQLKKDNAGNQAMQGKITEYETKIQNLSAELEQSKIDSALRLALLEAKADDIDYLAFKIKENGKPELGEDGKIKGINDTISAMKTRFPKQFAEDTGKKIEENRLPSGAEDRKTEPQTLADALKEVYENKN